MPNYWIKLRCEETISLFRESEIEVSVEASSPEEARKVAAYIENEDTGPVDDMDWKVVNDYICETYPVAFEAVFRGEADEGEADLKASDILGR